MNQVKYPENTAHEMNKDTKNVNICFWGRDDKHCMNCHWYDPKYHGGWCDKRKFDTQPDGYCSDFWED